MTKTLDDYPDVLTVEDIKEILHIGSWSAYNLLNSRAIASFKIGQKLRIPKQCLVDYINSSTQVYVNAEGGNDDQ